MRGASLRMKGVVYKACVRSVLTYGAETWAMKAGVFQRLQAIERRMLGMICGVTLKDMVESTVIASRMGVGVNTLEEDMKKRGVLQQDAGDREGWRRRAVKGLANLR